MLKFMATDIDVGYYGAATKIKTILVSVITSLGPVLLPRVSYYIKQNMVDEFYRITEKALNFVFILAMPLSFYFMVFAKYGVLFLSGNEYEGAILPMQIIMPTLLLIGITNILGIQILVPLGKEKYVLYSEIAGAIVDIILNALLIPFMQASGAAIGTLIAETVVFIVQFIVLKGSITTAFKKIKYWKIMLSILIGLLASLWCIYLNLGNFITLIISAFLFFLTYTVAMCIMKEKLVLEILSQILKKIHIL